MVELVLHAADIGSPAMPFTQFQRWNALVTEEFMLQGDLEKQEFGHLISPAAGFDRNAQTPQVVVVQSVVQRIVFFLQSCKLWWWPWW